MPTDVLTTDVPTTAPGAADATLAAVHEIAPQIVARAGEVEAARRVPPDLLDRLVDAGCFRLLLPTSHGGAGADLVRAMRTWEALARADASVGWTVMIGSGGWIDLARLPRDGFDGLYADGPDAIVAGVFRPSGSAVATDGGFRVTGRWGFASGCQHARWLYGSCLEVVDGAPQMRTAVFEPDEVDIEDTWRVAGLRGTGSHHFVVDVEVPAPRTFRTLEDAPCVDVPIVRLPPPAVYALAVASIAVGTARGALDEILGEAVDAVPFLASGPLGANPRFQLELAEADAEVRAARALLFEDAAGAWASVVAGHELTLDQRARLRATAVLVVDCAVAVVDVAYRAGGGRALYEDSPLQRRLRDVHAITQHFLVRRDALTTAGAVLVGEEADLTVF